MYNYTFTRMNFSYKKRKQVIKRHKPNKTDNFIDKSQNDERTNNINKKTQIMCPRFALKNLKYSILFSGFVFLNIIHVIGRLKFHWLM